MWVEGTSNGAYIRPALNTASWERAQELARSIETAEGRQGWSFRPSNSAHTGVHCKYRSGRGQEQNHKSGIAEHPSFMDQQQYC
jgi:hypothetical protein